MKIIKYMAVLLVSLLLSCHGKHSPNYIKGKVIDRATSKPIEGAIITLQYWNASGGGDYAYDSTSTHSDGSFVCSRKEKIGWQYRLFVRAKDYTPSGMDIDREKPPYIFNLDPLGYLKFRVKKHTAARKQLTITTAYSTNNYNLLYTGPETFYLSKTQPFDTIINQASSYRLLSPSITIKWSVLNLAYVPGVQNPKDSSANVTLSKGDTLFYAIEYD